MIGDYWDTYIVNKITEMLHEYHELFLTKFLEMKGILEDLGVMRILLKEGLLVDPMKIAVIVNLAASKIVIQLRTMLGHTGYYTEFIKGYAQITTPMEKLLKKDITFKWDEDYQKSFDILKEKMVTVLILVFLDSNKEFHVHVDAYCIALDIVLA